MYSGFGGGTGSETLSIVAMILVAAFVRALYHFLVVSVREGGG